MKNYRLRPFCRNFGGAFRLKDVVRENLARE